MSRIVVSVGLAALAAVTMPVSTLGQAMVGARETANGAPILARHGTLHARLEEIARRSSLWRDALEQIRGTGRQVLVLTPDQVVVKDTLDSTSTRPFDPTVVAAAAPIPDSDSQVSLVIVVVNLPLLEEVHRRSYSPLVELYWDLDRILVHEIYGHALPYLLAGDLSGRCPDPAPGQKASDACSIRRENAVRAELGLSRRTGYGLDLVLARRRLE
ncbi:MAG TPA: hypothetical protein VH702_11470 [Vicinamibacterales bacterium]|jgi:hypothetical protein